MVITLKESETKHSKFKGKYLIDPEVVPKVGLLEGNFGESFLEEYRRIVKANYNGNINLDVLKYEDGVIKGSNIFAIVLTNQILRQEGLRTTSQTELEKIIRTNTLELGDIRIKSALVLNDEKDKKYPYNDSLIEDLLSQLKERNINVSTKNPKMIYPYNLDLVKSDNEYGLTFRLREDAMVYQFPIIFKWIYGKQEPENNKKLKIKTFNYIESSFRNFDYILPGHSVRVQKDFSFFNLRDINWEINVLDKKENEIEGSFGSWTLHAHRSGISTLDNLIHSKVVDSADGELASFNLKDRIAVISKVKYPSLFKPNLSPAQTFCSLI